MRRLATVLLAATLTILRRRGDAFAQGGGPFVRIRNRGRAR